MAAVITANATYAIMNWGNKMVLDSDFNSKFLHRTDVCAAHISAPYTPPNQEWVLTPTGNSGEYTLRNIQDNLCIDLGNGTSTGSAIWGNTCQPGKASQQFVFTRLTSLGLDNRFCISNSAAKLVAGSTNTSTTDVDRCGIPVQGVADNCTSDASQQWMLWPLTLNKW